MDIKRMIREIPDFPQKNINFKDITTLLKDKEALRYTSDLIINYFQGKGITKVLGIEARGFIFGGILAQGLDAGFVPVRKKGKLPARTISETYALEYGTDCIEIHSDALQKNDVVLIHDDLLATGGTAHAVLNMVHAAGVKQIYFSFICDLAFIQNSKKEVIAGYDPQILVRY